MTGIKRVPHPEEAAKRLSRRTHGSWPSLFLRIAPDVGGLRRGFVDRPLRQGKTGRHIAEHHAYPRSDADAAHLVRRRQLAVRSAEVADDAQRFVGGRLTLLRVEIDEQYQIGRVPAKGR